MKKDDDKINKASKELFISACTERHKLAYKEFSTNTSSAKSLIRVLSEPKNKDILSALGITTTNNQQIRDEIIKLMQKACNGEDVISSANSQTSFKKISPQ